MTAENSLFRVGIYGASGYAGMDLVDILVKHPSVQLVFGTSSTFAGQTIPGTKMRYIPPEDAPLDDVDAVFLALPHGASAKMAAKARAAGKKVIDFGADFRFRNPAVYEEWYKLEHSAPEQTKAAVYGLPELKAAEEATRDVDGILVNVAVGYGGRREIADAVRSLLHEQAAKGTSIEELAEVIDAGHIAEHLYTKGQPDPDLVIRTSGEQRLSGFLLWQSAYSEFYFCDAYWPAFRRIPYWRGLSITIPFRLPAVSRWSWRTGLPSPR